MSALILTLSHCPNPDIDGGYWDEATDPRAAVSVAVDDFAAASAAARAYIERNGLGGGNWSGGDITQGRNSRVIAHVSYNGRVWDGPRTHWTNATTCRFNPAGMSV